MIVAIIVILFILWLLGYAPVAGISIPNSVLFTINNQNVTFWEILILVVIVWAIGILPRMLRTPALILLALWILSVLGILGIAGLSNIIVLLMIVGLIVSIFL